MREKTGKELKHAEGDAKQVTRIRPKGDGAGALSLGAGAIGALAVGALAIGALAIGRLVIRRLFVGKARIRGLEIDELEVKRLRVGRLEITDSLVTPNDDKTSSNDRGDYGLNYLLQENRRRGRRFAPSAECRK